jgi:hypothetical protein
MISYKDDSQYIINLIAMKKLIFLFAITGCFAVASCASSNETGAEETVEEVEDELEEAEEEVEEEIEEAVEDTSRVNH